MVGSAPHLAIKEESKLQPPPSSKPRSSKDLLHQDCCSDYLPCIIAIHSLSLTSVDSLLDFEPVGDLIDEMQFPGTAGPCPESEIRDGCLELGQDAKFPEKGGCLVVGNVDEQVAILGDGSRGDCDEEESIKAELDGLMLEKVESCDLEKCVGVPDCGGMGFAFEEKSGDWEMEGGGGEMLVSLRGSIEEEIGKDNLVCDPERHVSQEDTGKGTGTTVVNCVDASDCSSESESVSSLRASTSESCSSSESEGTSGDDDHDQEEDKVVEEEREDNKDEGVMKEDEMGEVKGSTHKRKEDVEEGEIQELDADEMVDWNDGDDDDNDNDNDEEESIRSLGAYEEDDDEGDDCETKGPIKSKNELQVLPPVPSVDVSLKPFHQMLPVGVVSSIIGSQVIVEGMEKHNPLGEGSILWVTENKSPLGIIDEIFGPVKNPYYIVRYNSESEIPSGIQPGISISFVQEFVDHVLNDKNLYQKGYDASGENDEEVSYHGEFSDDEKEAEYKRMLKMTKRKNNQEPGNRERNQEKPRNRNRTRRNVELSGSRGPADVVPSRENEIRQREGAASSMPVHNSNQSPILHRSGQVSHPMTVGAPRFPQVAQAASILPSQPHQIQGYNAAAGPVTSLLNHNSQLFNPPPAFGQVFPFQPAFVLGFPQVAQPQPGFATPNAPWAHGFQYHHQNSALNHGFQMNGAPWLQQNPVQALSTPFANAVPFQQQFDPSQGQGTPLGWTSCSPQAGVLGRPFILNQAPGGIIGSQGNLPQWQASEVGSSGPLAGPSNNLQPPPPPLQFNQNSSSRDGGRPFRGSGGHLGSRRGRHQR